MRDLRKLTPRAFTCRCGAFGVARAVPALSCRSGLLCARGSPPARVHCARPRQVRALGVAYSWLLGEEDNVDLREAVPEIFSFRATTLPALEAAPGSDHGASAAGGPVCPAGTSVDSVPPVDSSSNASTATPSSVGSAGSSSYSPSGSPKLASSAPAWPATPPPPHSSVKATASAHLVLRGTPPSPAGRSRVHDDASRRSSSMSKVGKEEDASKPPPTARRRLWARSLAFTRLLLGTSATSLVMRRGRYSSTSTAVK